MNKYAQALREFNKTFEPTVKFEKLIREEFNEWFTEVEERPGTEFELKELCDLLYVVYAFADRAEWEIEKNVKEVGLIVDKVKEYTEKYPQVNLAATVVTTAYAEFIINKEYIWAYRLVQGIFSYAKIKDLPLDKAFMRVHKSNMTKLEEGKVVRREDGKVLKGKNYKPPVLKDLLNVKKKVEVVKAGSQASVG